MGSFQIRYPGPERPVDQLIGELPSSVKLQLHKGFKFFSKIEEVHYSELFLAVTRSLESRQSVPADDLKRVTGLTEDEINSLISAAGFTVLLIAFSQDSSAKFIEHAEKAQLLEPGATAAQKFVDIAVTERAKLKRMLQRAALGSQGLPTLSQFDITLDARFGFQDGGIDIAVPVAIVHVDTDAASRELWFQVTKPQLENLAKEIGEALSRMKAIEAFLDRPTK